jgi:hypothetical protein
MKQRLFGLFWDYYNMNQLFQYGKWDYYTNKLYYMGSLHGILVCWLMISLGIIWTNTNWGWSAAIRGIPFSTNRSGDDDQSIVVVDQQAGWDSTNDHRDVSDMCYDDYHTRLKMILQSTLWDQDTLLVEFTYQLYMELQSMRTPAPSSSQKGRHWWRGL